MSYQGRRNGTNTVGANSDTYMMASVQTNDTVYYSVVVTNVTGSVTRSNAMLTVNLPPPPEFTSILRLPDQRAQLALSGDPGMPFAVDASSNLTSWFELMSGILTNTPAELMDHSASNASLRFYRARQ